MEIKNNGLVKLVYLPSTSYRGAPGGSGQEVGKEAGRAVWGRSV